MIKLQLLGARLFIFSAVSYLITEFTVAAATNYPLGVVYREYFVSALGVYPSIDNINLPANFSPLAWAMNILFIFIGITFVISNVFLFKPVFKNRNVMIKTIIFTLPFIFMIGLFMVAFYPWGISKQSDSVHILGAKLALIGGNFLLFFIGLAICKKTFKKYKIYSVLIGIFGLCSAGATGYTMVKDFKIAMVIFERLTIYPILFWQLVTGWYFFNLLKKQTTTK